MSEASGSPAPDAAASSTSPSPGYDPQIVGKGFVKAYYNQLLAKDQEKLVNYYVPSPTTYLSHAEGGEKTTPVALEDYKSQLQTTNRWGKSDDETMGLVMHAMDIHQTSSDTLLIVVTAVMRFVKSNDSGRSERQKFFVQTFLLARQGGWGVQNDVLRFLEPPATAAASEEKTAAAAPTNAETSSTGTNTEPSSPTKDAAVGTDTAKPSNQKEDEEKTAAVAKAKVEEDDAPGGGVEESKEEPAEEADEAESAPTKSPAAGASTTKADSATKEDKGKASKNKGSKPAPTPTPNSWASLVATGGSAPNTPSRKSAEKPEAPTTDASSKPTLPSGADKTKASDEPPKAAKSKPKSSADPQAAKPASSASTSKGGGGGGGRPDRKERTFNADCTLVIKNLDKASQEDVIKMFTPFATSTKSKLIGAHVNPFRKLAFVDFDAIPPVMAALKQHAESPLQWNGQVLEVDQKSAEQRARRDAARGGSYRSGSPSNGARNGGGGGGRGRGDRGGRRGGGGSRGGGRGGK